MGQWREDVDAKRVTLPPKETGVGLEGLLGSTGGISLLTNVTERPV